MSMRIKKTLADILVKASYIMAQKNANSACVFLHGHPEMPERVRLQVQIKRGNTG